VAEPAGYGAKVGAAGQQLGGGEVSQQVQVRCDSEASGEPADQLG
jgi:hypothetical protein